MGMFDAFKRQGDAPETKPFNEPRALRASAQVIKLESRSEVDSFSRRHSKATGPNAWQTAAWEYFDEVGEVKYAFYVMANTVSRIRIYPGVVTDPARPPEHVDEVEDLTPRLAEICNAAMDKLSSGPGGIPALMRDMALNLCVPGECYLVQIPERRGHELPETWAIYSSEAVKVDSSGNVALKMSEEDKNGDFVVLPKNAFVGRIWRSHPRYAADPDSSMRGLLGLLEELMLLNRTVRATARSRLNAGMLYLPDGLSVSRPEGTPYPEDPSLTGDGTESAVSDDDDEFESELIEAMTTPIQDEDSAAAVVPLIVRGPAELGEKIRQFNFERSFDPALAARADKLLDRILSGLDIPKEVVKGLADVKYSNAVVIDDQFFRSNVEPLVLMMVDALTTVYLRQYIVAHGFTREQANRVVLWYDPADVVVRPNRNEDANLGFDRYALSAEAWRRTHGFSELDAPDAEEVLKRLVISKGQIPDTLTEALLRVMAPGLMEAARKANPDASGLPPEVQQALGLPPSEAPVPTDNPPPAAEQTPIPDGPPETPGVPTTTPLNPTAPVTPPPGALPPGVAQPAPGTTATPAA